MDKYEYRLKAEQIEKLVRKKDYKTAAKIADTVDWRRVKNLNMLYTVSEIYEETERYGECMEILDMAYDRAPVGRMLLYRMTNVCTKMHNFEEAIALYREFVKTAPHDQSRYILKYQIYRERGSSLEDQIKILNEYKTYEYQEKWAYELAALYDQAGMVEECVRECDELILWFSEGIYVTKAMELKMKYEPLSASQQEKYNYQQLGAASTVREDGYEEPEVPGFDPGRFSTMNLQAELAENLDELLQEDKTIEFPSLQVEGDQEIVPEEESVQPEEMETQEPDYREDATIELPDLGLEGEGALPKEPEESEPDYREDATIELPDLGLGGEGTPPEGEYASTEAAEEEPEPDYREDATIELPDLGLEGEGTPSEGEYASTEAAEEEPEPDYREDATIELPDLGLEGEGTPSEGEYASTEAAEEEPEPDYREDATIELPDLGLEGEGTPPEGEYASTEVEEVRDYLVNATAELPVLALAEKAEKSKEASGDLEDLSERQDTDSISIDDILDEWEQKKAQAEAELEAAAEKERERKEKVKQETAELIKLITGPPEDLPEDVRQILAEIDEEKKAKEAPVVTEDDLPPEPDEGGEDEEEPELAIENLEEIKESSPAGRSMEDTGSSNMIQELKRSLASKVSDGAVSEGHLTKEQAKLFAYFTSVQGMSQQLSVLFKESSGREKNNSSRGNLTITGERGNGKTTLAIDIVKALQRQDRIGGKKLAKISGRKLNTKDVYDVLTRLKGGALIIESAGGLSDATMMALSLAMETDTGGLLVILEDSAEEIQQLFVRNRNFASKFDHTIDIPVFTNDELVAFGKSYALEQEYTFDEFGILALYDRIGSRQTNDHLVTVAEVKEIIDAAIEHAEKGSFRHLFEKVTKKSVDEFGNRLIREADFMD